MEILSLKDSVEKDTFFRKLPNLAEQLPRQIVLKKVCLHGSSKILTFDFINSLSQLIMLVIFGFHSYFLY